MPSSIKNAYVPITEINKLLIFCHTFCIIFERGSPNQDKMQKRKGIFVYIKVKILLYRKMKHKKVTDIMTN